MRRTFAGTSTEGGKGHDPTPAPTRETDSAYRADSAEFAVRLGDNLRIQPACGVILCEMLGLAEVGEMLGINGRGALIAAIAATLRRAVSDRDYLGEAAQIGVAGPDRLSPVHSVMEIGHSRFAILLPAVTDAVRLVRTAKAFLALASRPHPLVGGEVVVHGVAGVLVAGSDDAHDAMARAEFACHEARRLGFGQVVAYEPGLSTAAGQRLQMTSGVGQAAVRGELRVEFQPINDLRTAAVVGAEALVRWQHPDLGMLRPASFIPIAEQSNAIVGVGQWVLEQACDQLVAWSRDRATAGFFMNVNVSTRQLEDLTFPALVRRVLKSRSLDPALLTLELTETTLIGDTTSMREALVALKAVGVRLALDDFGVGYSSLSYLTRLPVDIVKIDSAFIRDLETSSTARELVGSITEMTHRLFLQVVAEGIETRAQRSHALRLGCDLGQGYYFHDPVTGRSLVEPDDSELDGQMRLSFSDLA